MGFSYGKLSQPHQFDDHDKRLKAIIRKGRITSFVILVGLVAIVVILLSMFLGKDTEMLTEPRSFAGGTTLGFLFCVAAAFGCWVGFRYPARWWTRLFSVPFLVLLIYALFMLAVNQYNRLQEYRLFNIEQSTIDYRQFTIIDLDQSRKKRFRDRRPLSVYVVVENKKYEQQGRLRTDDQTYDLLRSSRRIIPSNDRRNNYDMGYCLKLRVEHNDDAARIRVDGRATMDQLIKCPSTQSNQTTLLDRGT